MKRKLQVFNVQLKVNEISLDYHMNQTKNEKRKTKQKNDEQLSLKMVIKICEIRPKRWRTRWWEGFMEKISFEFGVELRWSDAQWKWYNDE